MFYKDQVTKLSQDITNLGEYLKQTVKYLAAAIVVAISISIMAVLRSA